MAQDGALVAPKDIAELKMLVVSRTKEFPESLKYMLELSFRRPEAVAFSNASSLAADCQIAPSSISRMVKALGYRSFREFRQVYRDHVLALSRRSSFASHGDAI
ncbi:MurR/RpiR family transcriptional regulator [Agrobacterium rhizogenes]|jgi:DNA-binding MurR/RpiR family transcriptional regulator|nr:MurR/RpiR family transcriptional regulator [Rhizobium rhizogenes]NTJ80063.1 MurR/RpiR family transcriptional regulator [Rhizobium rhizogenes]